MAKSRQLKYYYGITLEDAQNLLEKQGHRCVICDEPITLDKLTGNYSACVDHNHETGQVRGLLCGKCNLRIGVLESLLTLGIFDKSLSYIGKESK